MADGDSMFCLKKSAYCICFRNGYFRLNNRSKKVNCEATTTMGLGLKAYYGHVVEKKLQAVVGYYITPRGNIRQIY